MTQAKPTFEVDKDGLAKLLARRGIEFAVLELIQNALDEQTTQVHVRLERHLTKSNEFRLLVTDDNPEGFADLRHAYTLFAESAKKKDPTKRGRFNLGEKLVIAVSRETTIMTTKGTVRFDREGRHHSRHKTPAGTTIEVLLRMNQREADQTIEAVRSVLVPANIILTLNGARIESRPILHTFGANLATERADEEGYLRPTTRRTDIHVVEPRDGEQPMLYELGIPVVPIDCAWHIDVAQKVPLNSDRDNVTPAYLRMVRALVLNEMRDAMPAGTGSTAWVGDALESGLLTDEAVTAVIKDRYGDKVVVRDPSDPEGTKIAVSQGYAVIEPGTFSRAAWDSIRRSGAAKPAGQVTPSKHIEWSNDPDARDVTVPEEKWSAGMRRHAQLAERIGSKLLGGRVTVSFVSTLQQGFGACYGGWHLTYNIGRLGRAYFDRDPGREEHLSLLIHELGHQFSGDHLSSRYHEGLCTLGARLAKLLERNPEALLVDRGSP